MDLPGAPIQGRLNIKMHASSAAATALVEYSDVSSEDFSDPEAGEAEHAAANIKKPKPATENQFSKNRAAPKLEKEGYDNYR